MKLFKIIQKNFKIFMRSKVSALIIFLGPLLLVSLIGLSFSNSQLPGLTVGTYSPSYNEFTNSIVQKIEANNIIIQKFDTRELCSDAVKKSDASICLVFPENMDTKNNEVSFIVDYSKINLVWMVVDIFSAKVSERATELRQNFANELLDKVIKTKDDLTVQKTGLGTLNTKQGEAKTTIGSAKSNLDEISPTTDFGDTSTAADARTSISAVSAKIDDAIDSLEDAESKVSGSSLSETEQDAINDDLSDASSALSNAAIYLEGNSSVHSLNYIISDIESALENAKSQLNSIKTQKDQVKGELIALEGSISEAVTSITSLQSSVDSMISRIQNIQSSDADQLVSPIRTKIEPVTTQETHFNYLFPTLIVLIIMITAVLLSSTLVMNEKKSRSVFRNFITPTGDIVFNAGTFLTALIAIVIQLVIFLSVASLFFDTNILTALGSSIVALLLISSTFIALGMLIGYLFKSEETYVLAAITVSALLMFLSSTIMPIESISDSVRTIASGTPFVVSEHLLRQVMFFNFNLGSLWLDNVILLAYSVIFFGIIFLIQKLFRHSITFVRKDKKK